MKDFRLFFHRISYLQYPMMLVATLYILLPYFTEFEQIWQHFNTAFIFLGLSISFSTLQDTRKTQNELSRRIWENPKKGSRAIILLASLCAFFVLCGLWAYFYSDSKELNQLALGCIVLGIGLISMLKAAIEMFENHRLDRKKIE